jgi:ribonuclease E
MSDPASPGPAPEEDHTTPRPAADQGPADDGTTALPRSKRRRGTRGGRNRKRADGGANVEALGNEDSLGAADPERQPEELPGRIRENRPTDPAVIERALVRKPQIGDTRPGPESQTGGRPRIGDSRPAPESPPSSSGSVAASSGSAAAPVKRRRRRGGHARDGGDSAVSEASGAGREPIEALLVDDDPIDLDDDVLERRRGRERKGRPVGRYLMCVHVHDKATQIAVLEGRSLIEHYVSHPTDDVAQIHGNIYLGRVQNVLPGMEAAFVDIGTPKNAVLYRGDVQYDPEDIEEKGSNPRIEQLLKPRQTIVCQVTKNPIAHKGARLSQEVSLPGRFVVLIPNSSTYGISKRLPDEERKRLRAVLDNVKPAEHGVIVRTAAENVTSEEIERDVLRLVRQWEQIDALARRTQAPALLYREPDMAVRVIREEFNKEYRGIVIDDQRLFEEISDYVTSISPALADRVEFYDVAEEPLPMFERFHVHEQLHKALDRKVWLPSGGSLIIEHTEALTVIDVNTGKNVGTSSLEETVCKNNLEAAVEVARQLRLRDIGGIIVVDFIDMEVKANRDLLIKVFREALARDKTRTQVFDISDLGLVEMTRKRIGEGLLESFSGICPTCEGRGIVFDEELFPND